MLGMPTDPVETSLRSKTLNETKKCKVEWMKQTLVTVTLMTILSGCAIGGSADALLSRMEPLEAAHARALSKSDVDTLRSTGRDLLATLEAARGR